MILQNYSLKTPGAVCPTILIAGCRIISRHTAKKKSGDKKKATQYYHDIISFSADPEKIYPGNAIDNFISSFVLKKILKRKRAGRSH